VSIRPPANFIADSPGLDFLNSIATPVDAPVDWLDSGDGLVAWLAEANLIPAHALDALAEQAAPGELDKVADQARVLREWFRGFVRKHMGRPLTAQAMRELRRSPRAANDAALAIARISTAPDRRSVGAVRV
jgi:hypothetical protein